MKKKLIAMLLCATMVMGLTACGSTTASSDAGSTAEEKQTTETAAVTEAATEAETATASGEKTIVKFYEHSDNEKVATAQVEAYNASQDQVEVQLSIIANDDYDDKIKVMLAGGADVDCFWLRGGDQCRQLANDGALLALDDLNAANSVDMTQYGDVAQGYQTSGKTYGLCTSKSCWLLFYNKDLFDAAGVDYPIDVTWDEFADLCAQLNTADLNGGIVVDWIMNPAAASRGEYLTDDALTYTKENVQLLNRLYNEDQSVMSLEEMSAGSFDVNSIFAEGETYMMLNGDWTFLLFPDYNPGFEWAAAPYPHGDDQEVNSTIGSASAYCVAANSDVQEAAYDFIKFCCYSDAGAEIYAANACVPCYPSDSALEVYNQNVTVDGTEYVFAANAKLEDSFEDYYNELKDAYKAEMKDYLIGNNTFDGAFDNFIQRRDEIKADYE